MNTTLKTLIAAATLIASVTSAAQAADVPQARVSYADLNVRTAAGAAVLKHRIEVAAAMVCGNFGDRDPARRVRLNACIDTAMSEALSAVKIPAVQLAALK